MTLLAKGQSVLVRFEGRWREATVERVYDRGIDAIVGNRGCWYIAFEDMRALGKRDGT